jgi:hypothetical protein
MRGKFIGEADLRGDASAAKSVITAIWAVSPPFAGMGAFVGTFLLDM